MYIICFRLRGWVKVLIRLDQKFGLRADKLESCFSWASDGAGMIRPSIIIYNGINKDDGDDDVDDNEEGV